MAGFFSNKNSPFSSIILCIVVYCNGRFALNLLENLQIADALSRIVKERGGGQWGLLSCFPFYISMFKGSDS